MKLSSLPAILFSLAAAAWSPAALTGAGDLMFTGFNSDGNDDLSFVLLSDYTANTLVFFTDNEWDGSAWVLDTPEISGASETFFQWSSAIDITAGTVITLNSIGSGTLSADMGSASFVDETNRGLAGSNEGVYAYLGTSFDTPTPTFLGAIANSGFAASNHLLTNTGLAAGTTATEFSNSADIFEYNGDRISQQNFGDYRALIGNAANWIFEDGGGDQSNNATPPNVPFNTSPFAVVPEPGLSVLLALAGFTGIAARRRRTSRF